MSKYSFRMSDNVRQLIKEDAAKQKRSEAAIIKQILEDHYKLTEQTPPIKDVNLVKQTDSQPKPLKRPIVSQSVSNDVVRYKDEFGVWRRK